MVAEEPAPVVVEEPAPVVVEEPAPVVVEEPAPVFEEPAPAPAEEPAPAPAEDPAPAEEKKNTGKRIVLFATRTCPNCRMARVFLDKAGVEYGEIIADEHKELCDRFGVNSAPTLIVVGQEGYEKIVNVSNIKKYINEELVKH